jgi:chitodextrinase
VTGLGGTPGNKAATLTWTDPADQDLASIEIAWTPGGTAPLIVPKSAAANRANTATIAGLNNGTPYTFTVKAVDTAANKSAGETTGPHTPVDATAPADVTGLGGTPGNKAATLTWTDPADADLASIEIAWTPGGTAPLIVPNSAAANRANTATITGLNNETPYTFTVKAVDAAPSPNKSSGRTITLTPRVAEEQVTVEFEGLPRDETITLTGAQNVLSWSNNTALTVSVINTFDAYRWSLDSQEVPGASGSSLTLQAGNLSVKKHTLTVFVTKDGVEYAKSVTFTVEL